MSVFHTKLALELQIEGVKGRLPLSSCATNYIGNQIPQAMCQLGIGRNAYSSQVAEIHKVARDIKRFARAKVYMLADGDFDGKYKWPKKEVVIFEGRVSGPGQIVGEQAAYTMTLVHWLVDLHFSSTVSAISHPANPADMTWHAVAGYLPHEPGVFLPNNALSNSAPAAFKSATLYNFSDDVWGKGMKQILCGLAEQEHVVMSGSSSPCQAAEAGVNTQALAALARFDGEGDKCNRAYSSYSSALALSLTKIPAVVTGALLHGIRTETVESAISQTFWSKLIHNYSPMVNCGIVPLVDHALFAPITPGLRTTYCKEISADDYDNARYVFPITEPLRAVGIMSEKGDGVGLYGKADTSDWGIGGCFAPLDADNLGTIRFFRPPAWLNSIVSVDMSAMRTTGMKGKKPVSSVYTPLSTVVNDIKGGASGVPENEKVSDILQLYRDYAHYIFISNSLRGRVGSIAGKLRFDISPGSSIKVHAKHEPFIGPEDHLVNELFGTVVKVTSMLDAENSEAMTTFELSFVRTSEENESDSYSVDKHPLFDNSFLGAPLIDELQFGDCK